MKPLFLPIWLFVSSFSCLPTLAQDLPSEPADEVVDPLKLPVRQFEVLLKPRTKSELEALANQWQSELQRKASAVVKAHVMADRSGDPAERGRVNTLLIDQEQIAARYKVVIDAYQAKGGDDADHRAYLTSVTEANVLENPTMLTTTAMNWLKSPDGGMQLGFKVLAFLVTLVIARFLAGIVAGIVQRAMSHSKVKVTELLASFFVNTSRNLVMGLGVIVGLSLLGVPVGPFLAAMGAVGFIVGFALQDTLGNFAAGVMILFYRPYDIDDVISVAGETGKVRNMSLVSTTLITADNQVVVVPNSSIWGGIITNITGSDTRRVDLTFGIGYDDDVKHAQGVLEQLVSSHPLVLKDPEPVIRVHELADSSVNFICRPWVKTADYWSVYWDLTRMVKETFDAEGISIPYPQQDVHMHEAVARSAAA